MGKVHSKDFIPPLTGVVIMTSHIALQEMADRKFAWASIREKYPLAYGIYVPICIGCAFGLFLDNLIQVYQ